MQASIKKFLSSLGALSGLARRRMTDCVDKAAREMKCAKIQLGKCSSLIYANLGPDFN